MVIVVVIQMFQLLIGPGSLTVAKREAQSSKDVYYFRRAGCQLRLLPNESYPNRFSDDDIVVFTGGCLYSLLLMSLPGTMPPFLWALSPDPPISADLSTILQADTSGMSKHITSSAGSSPSSSPALPSIQPPLLPIVLHAPPESPTKASR
jgi:hypothetical protein